MSGERTELMGNREKDRRDAARLLLGFHAPEWLADLLASRGIAYLESGEGQLLSTLTRGAFGDEREPALREIAAYLVGCGVAPLVVVALLDSWALRFVWPLPATIEEDVVQIVMDSARAHAAPKAGA